MLGVVVTETLYRTHPDLPEGKLAKLRASVVNMRALADVARGHRPDGGLGAYLLLGRGEEATGGRDKSSILADALEALLGAVYFEHGLPVAAARGPRPVRRADARRRRARRAPGLEDQPAGAHRRSRPRRARVRDDLHRARPREDLHGARVDRRRDVRREHRPQQEGGRAGRRRARLPRDLGAVGRPAPSPKPRSRTLPELPEVETVRAGLDRWVTGRTVASGRGHARPRRAPPPRRARRTSRRGWSGARVEAASRRGKYLWLPLSTGEALVGHLGMSGQLLVRPPDAPDEKHLHVRIGFTDGGRELRFVDQRTFGGVLVDDLVPTPDRPDERGAVERRRTSRATRSTRTSTTSPSPPRCAGATPR